MLGSAGRQQRDDTEGPPWDQTKTLFEVLGVTEDASQAEIEGAYNRFLEAAGMDYGRLPPGVHFARNFLLGEEQRRFYRDRLSDCRSKQPISIPADKRTALFAFCERARIKWWADPVAPGDFHLRLQGQEPPDFVAEAIRSEQRQQRQSARDTERQRKRNDKQSNAGKLFFLRFGYVYAFAFAGLALFALTLVWGFDGTFSRWIHVNDVLDERQTKQIETEDREALALSTDATSQLDAALNSLRDTVRRELNAPLENGASLPDDLMAVIDKESTVAAAWKSLQSAYDARNGLEKRQPILTAVAARIRDKSFLKADVESLREIRSWATTALMPITSQKQNIDHIRAVLEVERFNRVGTRTTKEP